MPDRGTPRAAASSTSATRWRSLAWTPPGPTRLTMWSRPPGSRARAVAASRSAGRSKNEPSAIAASIRGRSWSTGRPAPRFRWPTSELPIWPGGRPTALLRRPQHAVRPALEQRPPASASARRRWRRRPGSGPMPNPSRTTRTIGRGRGVVRRAAARASRRARPRARAVIPARADDAGHLVGLERRAADQRAVDRRLGEELADVRRA